MSRETKYLFQNQKVDGNGEEVFPKGGKKALFVDGVFGSGMITLQVRGDEGSDWRTALYNDKTGITFSAITDTPATVLTKTGMVYRAVLSGSTGTTNLTAYFV